jgi:protein-disulfide isomerase
MEHQFMDSPKKSKAERRSRRGFSGIAAAAALTITGFFGGIGGIVGAALGQGADVAVSELMAPEVLPDIPLGASDAPVTIIEYASMTCAHCAAFYETTFPELKRKYIDTGKVRFILREFPLDPLAAAGFMLGRCAGDNERNAVLGLLFAQQKNWMFAEKPLDSLASLLKQTGMSQKSFDACLKNKELYDKILMVHDHAASKFGVAATPTFFINGKRQKGEITPDELDKLIDPLLKG